MIIFTQENILFDTKTKELKYIEIIDNRLHFLYKATKTTIHQYAKDAILCENRAYYVNAYGMYELCKDVQNVKLLLARGFYINNDDELYFHNQKIIDVNNFSQFAIIRTSQLYNNNAVLLTDNNMYMIEFSDSSVISCKIKHKYT
jgi:hypothetical protein